METIVKSGKYLVSLLKTLFLLIAAAFSAVFDSFKGFETKASELTGVSKSNLEFATIGGIVVWLFTGILLAGGLAAAVLAVVMKLIKDTVGEPWEACTVCALVWGMLILAFSGSAYFALLAGSLIFGIGLLNFGLKLSFA
jgi:hypothetical protein